MMPDAKPVPSIVLVGVLTWSGIARGQTTIPDPGHFVVDQAGIVEAATRQQLEGWLLELQQKTGAQIKVLTVSTLDGESDFDFFLRHAEHWKLGSAGQDNGALVGVAVQERKIRILPGYGLEPVLTDAWCGQLARDVFAAHFKQGDYSGGIRQGMIALANRVADAANISLTGIPAFRYRGQAGGLGRWLCGGGLMPFIIMIIVISSMARRRRHYGAWGGGGLLQGLLVGGLLSSMMGGGRHSSGWGGGGFGGGGFGGGGFGGGSFGGGGGFGGGGAGASW